jgi:hypothetical protein
MHALYHFYMKRYSIFIVDVDRTGCEGQRQEERQTVAERQIYIKNVSSRRFCHTCRHDRYSDGLVETRLLLSYN